MTAWNPGGAAASLASNQARQRALESEVGRRGWASCPASSYDVDLRWAESAIAVSAGAEADVLVLARRFEQPAVQRWTDGSLAVLASGTGDLVVEPTGAVTTRVDSRICPMRAVRGEPQEDDVCRGGPPQGRGRPIAVSPRLVASRYGPARAAT